MQPTDQFVASPPNPFAMMLDPAAVLQAIDRSDRLAHLQRRVCRPLDKPVDLDLLPAHVLAYDQLVDSQPDLDD